MPEMDGATSLNKMMKAIIDDKTSFANSKIKPAMIIITAYDDEKSKEKIKQRNIETILSKPISKRNFQ